MNRTAIAVTLTALVLVGWAVWIVMQHSDEPCAVIKLTPKGKLLESPAGEGTHRLIGDDTCSSGLRWVTAGPMAKPKSDPNPYK